MLICQFLVGIIGVTVGFNKTVETIVDGVTTSVPTNIAAVNAQIAYASSLPHPRLSS